MVDVVIGAVTNYGYHEIEPWLVSLEKTGFDGIKALVAYDMDAATSKKLQSRGVKILGFKMDDAGNLSVDKVPGFSIMVERFGHIWYFLKKMLETEPVGVVVSTDVRDVVFQSNPVHAIWEEMQLTGAKIVVAHENFLYKDEPWSRNNIRSAFGPSLYEIMKDKPIYCAGVVGGSVEHLMDLYMQTFLLCRGTDSVVIGGGGPDQAALNILTHGEAWRPLVRPAPNKILHAGTTELAIQAGSGAIGQEYKANLITLETYRKAMISNQSLLVRNDTVLNGAGIPYAIVHQYNRIPEWDAMFNRKYRE